MVIVACDAHKPGVGVNVYVVVAKLFNAGDQVPVMALFEVVGNAAKLTPIQIALTWLKVGVTIGFTVTLVAAEVVEHPPFETVTEYEPAVLTVIDGVVAPLLHK